MKTREFYEKLEKYAEVGIKIGLNVQAGQRVVIRSTTENLEFVRALSRQAYLVGAKFVDVIWIDEEMTQIRFELAPKGSFEEFPGWIYEAIHSYGKAEDAILTVGDVDPNLLKGFDPESVKTYQETLVKHSDKVRQIILAGGTNRLGIGAATSRWAAVVLPDVPEEERLEKMWDLIFELSRMNTEDPMAAWEAHVKNLNDRSAYFNRKQYAAFKFRGPGTDLTIGMPRNHFWGSAQMMSRTEISSVVNIPTEEVFCGPDRKNVNGRVTATKPLNVDGSLIDKFSLTFKDGKVIDAKAEVGEGLLFNLLDTDEGSRHLGEIALVPHSSPISQSGKLFYKTLYDENASSHLALGGAYRQSVVGGKEMSEAEFMAAGGNVSKKHVDFMIGSDKMDVDGLTDSGEAEPVMRAGEWAFEL